MNCGIRLFVGAVLCAAWLGSAHAQQGQPVGPYPPCSQFGSTAGTCLQGAGPLGTPSSGTLTNATGLPIAGGVSGLGTGVATLLGGASSGSGGPAGTTSPVFTTPNLGTPSALTLTNATGLPIAGIAGKGTNVAALLAANASAGTWTCSALSNATVYCSAAQGQLPGTTTNDNASAGNIGELFDSGTPIASIGASATVTITIAAPGVVSWASNPFFDANSTNHGCASLVAFSTSGTLPTGITAGTNYYVTCDGAFSSSQFHISTSVANAIAGTAITTSGSQSGTQTGLATFNTTSTQGVDLGGMALTAGDWDVSGFIFYNYGSGLSITSETAGIFGATGTTGTQYTYYSITTPAQVVGTGNLITGIATERISLSATTTVFCGTKETFTVSTFQASMFCRARRVR